MASQPQGYGGSTANPRSLEVCEAREEEVIVALASNVFFFYAINSVQLVILF